MPDKKVQIVKVISVENKRILFKSAQTTLIRYILAFNVFVNNQQNIIYISVNILFLELPVSTIRKLIISAKFKHKVI